MKRKRLLLCLFLIVALLLFCPFAQAEGSDYGEELADFGGDEAFEELPEALRQQLAELGITDFSPESLLSLQASDLGRVFWQLVKSRMAEPIRMLGGFLALAVISALFGALAEGQTSALWEVFSFLQSACLLSGVCLPMAQCLLAARGAMEGVKQLTAVCFPVLAALLFASGREGLALLTSGGLYAAFFGVLMFFSDFFLPGLRVLILFSAVGGESRSPIAAGLRGVTNWGSGILAALSALLVGFFNLQTNLAKAGDNLLLRTGKVAVSSLVPVVGGSLSEAAGGLFGSAGILSSSMGAVLCVALTLLFLPALLQSVCWTAVLGLSAAAAEALGGHDAADFFTAMTRPMKLLTILLVAAGAFFLLSVGSMSLSSAGGSG